MQKLSVELTVFFEDPFWVGVYTRKWEGRMEAARIVFGAQPTQAQLYERLIACWRTLRFSPEVPDSAAPLGMCKNPKRMQRAVRERLSQKGVGTKSQQAVKAAFSQMQETGAHERKQCRREKRQMEKERRVQLHQQKKKEKHRGK